MKIKLSDTKEISIEQDENPESPRIYIGGIMTKMVCFHKNYNLGDEHTFKTPAELTAHVTNGKYYYLPLYLYDHSGITMRTTPFECPWDSGQVGFIYIKKCDLPENQAIERMIDDVKIYDQFLTGNINGFIIYENGEHVDSCWGFYDLDSLLDHACLSNEEKDIVLKEFTW